ncbi:MAG TPA: RNA methyltransferase [Hypericibacter adhaerens]|uniref:RNA methyltransferase n=1 Tax=Hypericibacter adhaerens TaxID=2602016 RepID=UPI002BF50751|nr:RNA methyltransferase [Hypericibacter adhaerens]HWA45625.1 RNA methyltransferase [Hypericibacter adhaerens]
MATPGRRAQAPLETPAVILIEPQLPENIGATARAMMNCGLTNLRLVRPREQWPNERAREVSSGAHEPIDKAELYPSARAAMADLTRVYATSARHRQMIKTVMTPREAAAEMRALIARGERVGVMFGPERAGLENDELSLADAVIRVPLNPDFTSLNLAQAVLLIGYEWYQSGDDTAPRELVVNGTRPAEKEELLNFFDHLERELDASGFLRNAEKRPGMVRNIRNLFQRAGLTRQEIRTLHGIVKELSSKRENRPRRRKTTTTS